MADDTRGEIHLQTEVRREEEHYIKYESMVQNLLVEHLGTLNRLC